MVKYLTPDYTDFFCVFRVFRGSMPQRLLSLPHLNLLTLPSATRGPSARGAYMLRKSFVLFFIHFRVKARQHDQGFRDAIANTRTDQLTHRSTDPLIKSPRQKLLINKIQMTTAADFNKTNTRNQKFLSVPLCNFVAKN